MEILVATAEISPYSRNSEAADVCRALGKALRGLSHGVTVVSPLWRGVDLAAHSLGRRLTPLRVAAGERELECEIYDGRTSGGVNLVFVGNRELFGEEEPGRAEGTERDARQAALFANAIPRIVENQPRRIDLVQGHDWFSALALALLKREMPELPRVLALQNPDQQGRFAPALAEALGLDDGLAGTFELDGELNLLKGGLLSADRVVVARRDHAGELTGREERLGAVLDSLRGKLVVIANALDVSVWNPVTDIQLKARFDPQDLTGKRRCKAALQYELGLPVRSAVPLVFVPGGYGEQRNGGVLPEVLRQLLRNDLQLAVAGEAGNAGPEELRKIAGTFEDRMRVVEETGEEFLHRAVSGSDLLLIPPGLDRRSALPMCAHRYGTLPVVRKTGGPAETVVDCEGGLQTGTGFVFEGDGPEELLAAARRAVAAFGKRDAFEALKRRVMRIDHSWELGARRYEQVYRQLLAG